jgi:hypothetical protein
MGTTLSRKLESGNKLRLIIKSLIQIGANLSQTREYRDFFEDIVEKIAEPLEEAGFSIQDMGVFLGSCYYVAADISSEIKVPTTRSDISWRSDGLTKTESLKKDWLRFVVCCRLCLLQLGSKF